MLTSTQRDRKIQAGQKRVDTLRHVYESRLRRAKSAAAEAARLQAVVDKKLATAEAARKELEHAEADLVVRQTRPVA